ncbi:MAG: EAL domain-containing protein [Deinococcales bacterium]
MGLKLYLDDFGTGYSSLSYLHRFPIDAIKLDRSFIMNMNLEDSRLQIVRAMISMAKDLGIEVVAEGVEDYLHLQKLREWDCAYGQGFLFDQPLSAEAANQLLVQHPSFEISS